jgi:UDP-arabinose 4-epimerase
VKLTNVLVTGGAGYIGSHTCKALAASGFLPIVLDNLSSGHKDAVKWGAFVEGDIINSALLDRVFAEYSIDLVIHFAAYAYVGESVKDPEKYYQNNVAGTISLLAAMRRNHVNNIVFSSTCATYGDPKLLPITEETPQNPINPYGRTKLIIEMMLREYRNAYGLNWCALRYFNAAGCDPDGELGERHYPETHAIPLAIAAALGKAGPFKVMGTDYDTHDGTAIRDYVHVSDLADAHVKAAQYLLNGGESHAFNLATGQGISVKEILAAVRAAAGCDVPHENVPRREGDPPSLFAQAILAKTKLGWTPKFVDVKETVKTAVNWFNK